VFGVLEYFFRGGGSEILERSRGAGCLKNKSVLLTRSIRGTFTHYCAHYCAIPPSQPSFPVPFVIIDYNIAQYYSFSPRPPLLQQHIETTSIYRVRMM